MFPDSQPLPSWIRAPMLPEHCREIEGKSQVSRLATRLTALSSAVGVTPNQIERLRATRLPVLPPLVLLEAQITTPKGPALASFLWQRGKLEALDRHITLLSLPMWLKIAANGTPRNADQIAYAQIFCACLPAADWLFWPCRSLQDLEQVYALSPASRAAISMLDFDAFRIEGADGGLTSLILAYGPQLFRAHLRLRRNGRIEMVEDTAISDLPLPRLARGPNGWVYLTKENAHA